MNNHTKSMRRKLSRKNPVIEIVRPKRIGRLDWGTYAPQIIKHGEQPRKSRRPKVGGTG